MVLKTQSAAFSDPPFPADSALMEVLANSTKACIVTRTTGEIVGCNTIWCEMCEYTPDECLGKSPKILQGPGTDLASAARFRKQLNLSSESSGTLLNYTKTGEQFIHYLHSKILVDNGVNYFVTESTREVVERPEFVSFTKLIMLMLFSTALMVCAFSGRFGTDVYSWRDISYVSEREYVVIASALRPLRAMRFAR